MLHTIAQCNIAHGRATPQLLYGRAICKPRKFIKIREHRAEVAPGRLHGHVAPPAHLGDRPLRGHRQVHREPGVPFASLLGSIQIW